MAGASGRFDRGGSTGWLAPALGEASKGNTQSPPERSSCQRMARPGHISLARSFFWKRRGNLRSSSEGDFCKGSRMLRVHRSKRMQQASCLCKGQLAAARSGTCNSDQVCGAGGRSGLRATVLRKMQEGLLTSIVPALSRAHVMWRTCESTRMSILSRALVQATGRSCLFRIEKAGLRDCGGAVPRAQTRAASGL